MIREEFIKNNLDNLGELDRSSFKYLSDNIELFFEDYSSITLSENSFNKLSYLFKIISYDDFPKEFDLTEVKIKYINGKLCLVNKYKQLCYEEDGELYITPLLVEVDGDTFYEISKNIKHNLKIENQWKQKFYSKDIYNKYSTYISGNSCAVALQGHRIINVFKASNIDYIKEADLIYQTIELGGKLLESYKEDFIKYVKLGFMPVSICKWEDSRAPKSWVQINKLPDDYNLWKNIPEDELKIKRQDIIFYIYTNQSPDINFNEWLSTMEYSDSYEDAKSKQKYIYNKLNEEIR